MSVLMDTGRVVLTLDPGVCRLTSKIEVYPEGDEFRCKIESRCTHVQDFASQLDGFTMMDVIKMPFCENKVYAVGGRTLKHSACPVPMAVLKAAEVAAGLGLKRDVHVTFEKTT
ncbi:MAG TPA: hypothetical protein VEH08_06485 [Methanomassiliicoccales archaeon]|nr:hypothetical protein [Methanomassiliicoccales archaeon]